MRRAACDRAARRSALAGRGGRVRARPVRAALIVAAGIVLLGGRRRRCKPRRHGGRRPSRLPWPASMRSWGGSMTAFPARPRMFPRRSGTSCFRWRASAGCAAMSGSRLVGFEHAGSAPDALREVQDALERGGWRMTAAGQGLCATFSKDRRQPAAGRSCSACRCRKGRASSCSGPNTGRKVR